MSQFKVGQQVVAIEDHPQKYFKKGDVFTVASIHPPMCKCGYNIIGIGIHNSQGIMECGNCLTTIITDKMLFRESRFVPIEEQFQAISFTKVLEQELVSVN